MYQTLGFIALAAGAILLLGSSTYVPQTNASEDFNATLILAGFGFVGAGAVILVTNGLFGSGRWPIAVLILAACALGAAYAAWRRYLDWIW